MQNQAFANNTVYAYFVQVNLIISKALKGSCNYFENTKVQFKIYNRHRIFKTEISIINLFTQKLSNTIIQHIPDIMIIEASS